MTDPAQLAESCARSLTRRWGGRHDWRDLLGACWEGIDRAIRAGETDEVHLRRAAFCGATRYVRWSRRAGWGRAGRQLRVRPVSAVQAGDEAGFGSLEPIAGNRPDPGRRLLALWCETRAERNWWPWRLRVMMYLYCCEGMTEQQVAESFGVSRTVVNKLIARAVGPAALSATGRARQGDSQRTCTPANSGAD